MLLHKYSSPHLHTDTWMVGSFTYCRFELAPILFPQNNFLFLETVQKRGEVRIQKKNTMSKTYFSSQFSRETAELRKGSGS